MNIHEIDKWNILECKAFVEYHTGEVPEISSYHGDFSDTNSFIRWWQQKTKETLNNLVNIEAVIMWSNSGVGNTAVSDTNLAVKYAIRCFESWAIDILQPVDSFTVINPTNEEQKALARLRGKQEGSI